ncbi:stalk domain-containing protein [Bacillus dakarensis]|uniref:stalk domain-containing protein n=1 Tax=Robertmurraya dakarensis TaxID=1926278 RepID=UPI000980C1A2|nr:stalk domain-containing protein [Bacillus dakarensis]
MWRISFSTLIILIFLIWGMLLWQWNTYVNQSASTNGELNEKASQHISIETNHNQLQITQKVNGIIPGKTYTVLVPETISEWVCLNEDGTDCMSEEEDPFSIFTEESTLSLIYRIQLNNKSSAFLLHDWIVQLHNVHMKETTIELVDLSKREGSWAAGLPLKAYKELNYIDYYVFSGEERNASIYWQPDPLFGKKYQDIQVYYSGEDRSLPSRSFELLNILPASPVSAIVLSDLHPEAAGQGLLVLSPGLSTEDMERKVVYQYFFNRFDPLSEEEIWLVDLLASAAMGKDANTIKGNELIQELKGRLSSDEWTQFVQGVLDAETLSVQKLDEILGSLKGKQTSYFSLNRNQNSKLIPLYYLDLREILIKDTVLKDQHAILVRDELYFPFIESMNNLGFNIHTLGSQDTILINKDHNRYRFYVDQNIFIYNEEDYGLLENPLIMIDGRVYMKDKWLDSLFQVEITEGETQIKLSLLEK